MSTLDRIFWMLCILTFVETLRFAYAIGYDYACYWGYLA